MNFLRQLDQHTSLKEAGEESRAAWKGGDRPPRGGCRPPDPPEGLQPPLISPQEAFSRMELPLGVQLDFIALIDLHRTRAL